MVFSSSTFLFLFLPIVLILYFLINKFLPIVRNSFLLIASLLFYGFGEPTFVFVLVGLIIINWAIALCIDRMKNERVRTVWLIVVIFLNAGLLIGFKYINFITRCISFFIHDFKVTKIALPIGISFFTFQAMSYVVDVYRRRENAQANPINFGLYISFFPQLIAGPIVRYSAIAIEIIDRRSSREDFTEGVCCFIRGLFKKIVFANNLAIVADMVFGGQSRGQSVLVSWLGALAYTLQIYFDFSGYSDMAYGLARVFGFHFPKNFNYPYTAKSITDFWRRWHISLSSWFKDYVYIPLGGSMGGWKVQARNLFIVWLMTGIWHGANWTFILWGLVYFVMLIVEKFIIHPERIGNKALSLLYRLAVFVIVMFCWVLFRSDSVIQAVQYLKSMLGLYSNPMFDSNWCWYFREYIVFLVLGILLSTKSVRWFLWIVKERVKPVLYEFVRGVGYVMMFVVCLSYLVIGAHNPFIYFNF